MLRVKYNIDHWNVDNWNVTAIMLIRTFSTAVTVKLKYGGMTKIVNLTGALTRVSVLVMLQKLRLLKKVCDISDIMLDMRTVRILMTDTLITAGMLEC